MGAAHAEVKDRDEILNVSCARFQLTTQILTDLSGVHDPHWCLEEVLLLLQAARFGTEQLADGQRGPSRKAGVRPTRRPWHGVSVDAAAGCSE